MTPGKPVRGLPLFSKPEGIGEGTGENGERGYQQEIEDGQDDPCLKIPDASREDFPKCPESREKMPHDCFLPEGVDEGRED